MSHVADTIRKKLQDAFDPDVLEVLDQSAQHAGHSGARDGGESHFDVVITASAFKGKSRVMRQREVYAVLSEELAGPIHALSLRAMAPGD